MYTFLVTGEQSGGAVFSMEASVPGGGGPPLHIHDREDEMLYILEGTCDVWIADQHFVASAGDFVLMPKGIVHRFSNTSTEPLRLTLTFVPSGIEHYFEEVFAEVDDRTAEPPPVTQELVDRLAEAGPRYGMNYV